MSRAQRMQQRDELPVTLYTAEQCQLLDRTAIQQFGIPGFRLMQRAGQAVFNQIRQRWPNVSALTVVCGSGNNGGDGLIVAGLALQAGLQVQLCVSGDLYAERLRNEALLAWNWLESLGAQAQVWEPGVELTGELIVDALFGIGLNGAVRGDACLLIDQINRLAVPVVAVDIPSGLDADTGQVLGKAIKADLTLTFIGLKQGMLTGSGVDHCGELLFDSLQLPDAVYEEVAVSAFRTCSEDQQSLLKTRARSSHKGKFGHVLVVGGDYGFAGAALIAAQAALRCGAGLVTLATREEHASAALVRVPELMCQGIEDADDLEPLLSRCSVIVCGPGLGQDEWGQTLLTRVLETHLPLLLDADALNLVVRLELQNELRQRGNLHVLTPHPGEAARLLDTDIAEVEQDRFDSVRTLQESYGGAVVLKGAGTLTYDGDVMHLCSSGNPGMASGGMGDLLSGVIGGLLAQGLQPTDAARLGVRIHALAGDMSALEAGERGMLATDLLKHIRTIVNHTAD